MIRGPLTRMCSSATPERGFVPIELVLGIGLLLFPVTIMVLALPRWSERQTMARTAATEAARAWARSNDDLAGSVEARRMVDEIAANYGVDPALVAVAYAGSVRHRGGIVTVTITVPMPKVSAPGMGAFGGWHWTTSHSEAVDKYRSYD